MDGFLVGRPWMPPGGRPGVLLEKEQLRVHQHCPSVSDAASGGSFGASFSVFRSSKRPADEAVVIPELQWELRGFSFVVEDDAVGESRYASYKVEAYAAKENLHPALFGDEGPSSRGGSELSGRGGSELSASGSPRQKTKSPRAKRDPAKETLKAAKSKERHAAREALEARKANNARARSPCTPVRPERPLVAGRAPRTQAEAVSSPFSGGSGSPFSPSPSAYEMRSVSAANTPRGGSPTNDSPHSGSPTANGEKYQRLLTDGEAADAARNGLPMDDAFRYEDGMDVLKISGAATVGSVQLCVVPRAWLAAINQGHPCFFQWFRGREGSKEPAELIQGAVSAKLISSPDDEDKQLQVVAALSEPDGSITATMTAITPVLRKREKSRRPSTFLSQQSSPVHHGSSPQNLSPLLDRSRRQSAHSMGSPSVITPVENADGDTVLQVIGECVVGERLTVTAPEWTRLQPGVRGSPQAGGLEPGNCKIQWLRGVKERTGRYTFNKIAGAKTPRYKLVPEDANCRLRVVAAPLLLDGSVGKAWTALTARIVAAGA